MVTQREERRSKLNGCVFTVLVIDVSRVLLPAYDHRSRQRSSAFGTDPAREPVSRLDLPWMGRRAGVGSDAGQARAGRMMWRQLASVLGDRRQQQILKHPGLQKG